MEKLWRGGKGMTRTNGRRGAGPRNNPRPSAISHLVNDRARDNWKLALCGSGLAGLKVKRYEYYGGSG